MTVYKPKGVELTSPTDFKTNRQRIFDKVLKATQGSFPKVFNGVRMELAGDLAYEGPESFTPEESKQTLLNDKDLVRKLRGTVNLFDDATGDLLDSQKVTLANVPWLSDRGTFVRRGNNYTSIMQQRLRAGPYGRVMDNGQVETHFNVKPGTGPSYRVMLEPDTAQFRLRVGPQASIHLMSVLRDMGVKDDELKTAWGDKLWQRNADAYNPKAFDQAYARMVPAREQQSDAPMPRKAEQLRAAFQRSQVLASIRDVNLPTGAVKMAEMDRARKETDHVEEDDLSSQFQPDLTPEDLRLEYNSLYGRHGPRLASMNQWPDRWINHDADPLGWLEWYGNYHGGRRAEDDTRQIRRWLSFRRRQLALYKTSPTPRRGFALRNWAIDGVRHLPEESRDQARKDMELYKDKAWADWAAKRAFFRSKDMEALSEYWRQKGAALDPLLPSDSLPSALLSHVLRDVSAGRKWEDPEGAVKAAFLVHHVLDNPDSGHVEVVSDRLLVKTAYGSVDLTSLGEMVTDILSWHS